MLFVHNQWLKIIGMMRLLSRSLTRASLSAGESKVGLLVTWGNKSSRHLCSGAASTCRFNKHMQQNTTNFVPQCWENIWFRFLCQNYLRIKSRVIWWRWIISWGEWSILNNFLHSRQTDSPSSPGLLSSPVSWSVFPGQQWSVPGMLTTALLLVITACFAKISECCCVISSSQHLISHSQSESGDERWNTVNIINYSLRLPGMLLIL